MFAGRVKSVSHSSCRTSAILTKFCPLRSFSYDSFVKFHGKKIGNYNMTMPGRVAQSVMCLTTDASLTADPGVASLIPARSHTFMEIELRSFSSLPLNHSRRIVVSYKPKYVHKVLVNCLFKLAQEKVWLGDLTVPP